MKHHPFRTILAILAIASVLSTAWAPPTAGQEDASDPLAPDIGAASAILIDVESGEELWSKDPDQRRPVASTTKILTALLVLEDVDLEDEVVVGPSPARVDNGDRLVVKFGLVAGERVTVEDLLFALLLESANDAAIALAEHVGGTVTTFVDKMNERAVALGATGTRFRNPHGLDEPGHFSTARDMSLFALAALRHAPFRRIVGSEVHDIETSRRQRSITNRNDLLSTYPGATGIKTGQTEAAGRALVASAARGDEERVAVILGTRTPQTDAAILLDHGLEGFKRVRAARAGSLWGVVTFADGLSFEIVLADDVDVLIQQPSMPIAQTISADAKSVRLTTRHRTIEVETEFRCGGGPCPAFPSRQETWVDDIWDVLRPLASAVDGWLVDSS